MEEKKIKIDTYDVIYKALKQCFESIFGGSGKRNCQIIDEGSFWFSKRAYQ